MYQRLTRYSVWTAGMQDKIAKIVATIVLSRYYYEKNGWDTTNDQKWRDVSLQNPRVRTIYFHLNFIKLQ